MPRTIKQLFFDCDNTLVFSEQLAFEACADVTNELLTKYNINNRYTSEQLIIEFVGMNFRNIMAALRNKYGFTMSKEEVDYWVKQEEVAVIAKLQDTAYPCEGSMEVLEKLHKESKYGLGVVSSSALRRIRASLEKAGQDKYILHDHVFSAVTSLPKPTPKPDPAVYEHAMETIGVKPEECITVEDSKSGALSAIRAKVTCIAYVGAYSTRFEREQVAKTLTDLGCTSVMYSWDQYFDCLKQIEGS